MDRQGVLEARKACRQFAMQYFQFCRALRDALGEPEALKLAQQAVFQLSLDRTDRIREAALAAGVKPAVENFLRFNDLPLDAWSGWDASMGGYECPYAEQWVTYFDEHPWFRRFATLYCDVIDTTNIENYSRDTSHRITANVMNGDPACEREYFPSDAVSRGAFTYGSR